MLMKIVLCALVCLWFGGVVQAGPNVGGVLLAHDAGLRMSATIGSASVCSQGVTPSGCSEADTEIDGASPDDPSIFKVYAAFPSGSSPRVIGVVWGINYDANALSLLHHGKCGDFELNDETWPAPGTGSTVIWNAAQTSLMTPIYWFAASNLYGAPVTFDLGPHPSQGGFFGDDSVIGDLDRIWGYGRLGFDTPGELTCQPSTPIGACCSPIEGCRVTTESECTPPDVWVGDWTDCESIGCPSARACCTNGICEITFHHGCLPPGEWMPQWASCDPNPCPQPPVPAERTSWGRIKALYR